MIRRLLETRNRRERILLCAFIWALLLLWALLIISSARDSFSALSEARMELAAQKAVLSRSSEIKDRLTLARSSIDPAKALGPIRLSSTVDDLARKAGLTADIGSPQSKDNSIFKTSSVRISARGANLEQLINFTQSVRQQAPYLALRRFKMSADQRNPQSINAEIEIESFELNTALSR
ncbi:MAG: hypothetical protein JW942_02900 [Opitutales bacterium]|nr:hypothetical protein [Opitutales bacterium]